MLSPNRLANPGTEASVERLGSLHILQAAGFSTSVDAFAWEPDPDPAARRVRLWLMSLLGPQGSVKALPQPHCASTAARLWVKLRAILLPELKAARSPEVACWSVSVSDTLATAKVNRERHLALEPSPGRGRRSPLCRSFQISGLLLWSAGPLTD